MTADTRAWLALSATPGLGTKTLAQLARRLKVLGLSVTDLINATSNDLIAAGIPARLAEKAKTSLANPPLPPELAPGIQILTPGHEAFPMRQLYDGKPIPVVLYAMGQLDLLAGHSVGVSGSRSAGPDITKATLPACGFPFTIRLECGLRPRSGSRPSCALRSPGGGRDHHHCARRRFGAFSTGRPNLRCHPRPGTGGQWIRSQRTVAELQRHVEEPTHQRAVRSGDHRCCWINGWKLESSS